MKNIILLTLVLFVLAACANNEFLTQPAIVTTTTSSPLSFVPLATASYTPSPLPLPTAPHTVSPEPDVAPNCEISNEEGQLYLLSDQEFRDLRTHQGIVDQALAAHYPEWAHYTQIVSGNTEPVKLGDIIVSVSYDEESNLQINPAVTLVTLGDSLNWQLPPNTDLYLKSQEISIELNRLSFDWEDPFDDSLRRQYPEVANSGTYALYAFFDYNLDRLQSWCSTYQQLFGTSP